MDFIVKRYRLLIFLCFIHYNVNSHLIHSSHRFPDLFKTDRDEETKTRVSEGTQTSRLSIKTGHGWRSSDAIMAGHNGDASSETHRENLAWKDSVDRRLRDLEMGSRPFPEEQAEPEVKREIDTCGGEIKRLTDEVSQVRRELEAAKTDLKDVQNALATIHSDREALIDKQMTAHGTQEIITNPIGHVTDGDLNAFKDAHGELKTKIDHQKETSLNLNKTKDNGVVELIQELHNQVSSEQEASTKLHVGQDHLIQGTIFENLKVAIASQYIESTASPTKRRRRREGSGALTTVITSFLYELQQYNKTIQDEKSELMRMSHDSVAGNDLFKLEKCQTDVRTLAQNLENTETVLDLIQVGLREEKRFVRSHLDELENRFINQQNLLEINLNETTDRLANVSMEVDSVSTSFGTFRDNYNSNTNAQIDDIKLDVDKLKMLCKVDGGWSNWVTWSTCSATCAGGTASRSRACDNPAPAYSGADCSGSSIETTSCNTGPCPVDGGLTTWTAWATCSMICGGGSQRRTRSCSNPSPAHGGAVCTGATSKTQTCNTQNCPNPCPNGYIHKAPFCLRIERIGISSFDGAVRACQAENAHLITEVATRMFFRDFTDHRGYHYWVGAKKNVSYSGFVWLSSDDYLSKHDPMWGDYQPDSGGRGNENCVEWAAGHGGLNDIRCIAKFAFICEKSEYRY